MTFQLSGDAPDLYERVMVPLWFARWGRALVDLMALRPGETVLDVACGTGVTTRMAKAVVGPGGRVDGLDISGPMLARAKDLAAGLDIRWIESDVCDGDLPPGSYDVILSQHGYQYFPGKRAALEEFRRLLLPGGRLGLSIWDGHSPYTKALCAAVAQHISPGIAQKQHAQRQTPGADDLAEAVRRAGFSQVTVHRQELMIDVPSAPEFVPLHLGSMPIADAYRALSEPGKIRLIADVAEAMADYVRGDRLTYPDAVHVVTGVA